MAKDPVATYPKVYAEVISLVHFASRAGVGESLERFTPDEWTAVNRRPSNGDANGKRANKNRYYLRKSVLTVRVEETGEILELDPHGYQGFKGGYDVPGARIKIYSKPNSSRRLFKMTGE